jgi:uncharacterized integral membrane protein
LLTDRKNAGSQIWQEGKEDIVVVVIIIIIIIIIIINVHEVQMFT